MKPEDFSRDTRREARFRYGLVILCAVATVVWMVRGVFQEPTIPDPYNHANSTSPAGHSALAALLREDGREVRIVAASLRLPLEADETLALLEPTPHHVEAYSADFERLFAEARQRTAHLVLALPKRGYEWARTEDGVEVLHESLLPEADPQSVLNQAGLGDALLIQRRDQPADINDPDGFGPAFSVAAPLQFFRWGEDRSALAGFDEAEVLLETDHGEPVAIRLQLEEAWEGGLILLADPDLLTNRYIAGPGAATQVLKLFELTEGPIIIEETLHGFATEASLEYVAMTAPGLWVTLSGLMLLGLLGWHMALVTRPAQASNPDRRSRIYAVDGMARMMARAQDHGAAWRALVRRSRLVLGRGTTVVRAGAGAGHAELTVHAGHGSDAQKLLNAASGLSHLLRAGETAENTAPEDTE